MRRSFARGVDASQIVSLLNRKPTRVESTPAVLHAMADVSNEEITRLMASPYILYVEGESDERILRAWAGACGAQEAMDKVCFKTMGGGGKKNMKERADAHFVALQQIVPGVARLMLFDFDDADEAFHPKAATAFWPSGNARTSRTTCWCRAWRRAALQQLQCGADDLFAQSTLKIIDDFFVGQNLTLPPGRTWREVNANIFSVVNGKDPVRERRFPFTHSGKAIQRSN